MAAAVFPLIPRRRVIGLAFGGVRSARRGVGSDVASTREYRPGDDVGWMDWAASARLSAARGSDEFIVRERFADEAPRVVVLTDRRLSMSIPASRLRALDKPSAILTAIELIGASAMAARSLTGYLDYADGEPYWRPPRTEVRAEPHAPGTMLRWRPVASATYYNVQLWLRGKKVLTTWPSGPSLRLPRLKPGPYTWFVWPGRGPRALHKYGPLLGKSTFIVRG